MTENNGKNGGEKLAHKALFPDAQSAEGAKPESKNAKMRLFEVLKGGDALGFAWGGSVNDAIVTAARLDGYTARVADPKGAGPLTKEKVASKLAEFTDEELAEMGLTRKKGKK